VEIIAVCSEIHTEHTHALFGPNFLMLDPIYMKVTTGLQWVKLAVLRDVASCNLMFSKQKGAARTCIRLGWGSWTVFLTTMELSYCAEGCFHSVCVNTSGCVRKVPASSLGRHTVCPARAYSWYPAVCCVSALKWDHDSIFAYPLH